MEMPGTEFSVGLHFSAFIHVPVGVISFTAVASDLMFWMSMGR